MRINGQPQNGLKSPKIKKKNYLFLSKRVAKKVKEGYYPVQARGWQE